MCFFLNPDGPHAEEGEDVTVRIKCCLLIHVLNNECKKKQKNRDAQLVENLCGRLRAQCRT